MTQPFGTNSLFPVMPQVPWVYVHQITIRKINTDAGAVDKEGRWIGTQSISRNQVKAFVSPVSGERTVTTGEAREEEVTAVARVQRNTDVRFNDEVEVSGVSFDLDGVYRITRVAINPIDIRLMLHRVADDSAFAADAPIVSGQVAPLTSGSA